MTFDDALAAFLRSRVAAGRKPRTVDWYAQQVGRFHDWLVGQSWNGSTWLRPEVIETFLSDERAAGMADSTIAARVRALKIFFGWLVERGYLERDANPMTAIKPGKLRRPVPRVARPDQVARLLASIVPRSWVDLRDRVVIQLLDQTGARVSELVAVTVADVDIHRRMVLLRETKSGDPRLVPFRKETVLELIGYLDARPERGDRLFLAATGHGHAWPDGRGLTDNGVRQMLRRRCETAEITYLNPHSFRHGLAMKLMNQGRAPTSLISNILGHADEKTTKAFYARWESDALVSAYDEAIGRADER